MSNEEPRSKQVANDLVHMLRGEVETEVALETAALIFEECSRVVSQRLRELRQKKAEAAAVIPVVQPEADNSDAVITTEQAKVLSTMAEAVKISAGTETKPPVLYRNASRARHYDYPESAERPDTNLRTETVKFGVVTYTLRYVDHFMGKPRNGSKKCLMCQAWVDNAGFLMECPKCRTPFEAPRI